MGPTSAPSPSKAASISVRVLPAAPRRMSSSVWRASPSFPGGSCADPYAVSTAISTRGRSWLSSTRTVIVAPLARSFILFIVI